MKISLQWHRSKMFFQYSELDRMLSLSMVFSCFLVLMRICYTGRLTFIFLVWNLFLAYLPYFITRIAERRPLWIRHKILFVLFFLLWLLCIPNSFYILTDLYHLGDFYNDYMAPNWYDLSVLLSFAWNGLLLGILSVRKMEKIFQRRFFSVHELLFVYPVMCLNALGIYTGRYLRFNSWDVLTAPFDLLHDLVGIFLHPLTYRFAWGMVLCFSIMMTMMYLTVKRIAVSFF
jgi:uncharacterized membrane protein